MVGLVAAILLFHFSILLKIVPYDITWGGRLQNDSEMYVFESVSIIINLVFLASLLIKGRYIKEVIPMKAVNVILWVFLVIFGFNTIGNIFSETNFEKLFTLVTLAFVFLIWSTLRKRKAV